MGKLDCLVSNTEVIASCDVVTMVFVYVILLISAVEEYCGVSIFNKIWSLFTYFGMFLPSIILILPFLLNL